MRASSIGFAGLLFGCTIADVENRTHLDVPVTGGWTENERLIIKQGTLPNDPPRRYREGITKNGLKYQIYSDGSGAVGVPGTNSFLNGWTINCKKDRITDEKFCTVSSYEPPILFFNTGATTSFSMCIFSHDFPGKSAAIRFDNDPAIYISGHRPCLPNVQAKKNLTASTVTVRYYRWPYAIPRDESRSTVGIKEAIALSQFIDKKISSLAF